MAKKSKSSKGMGCVNVPRPPSGLTLRRLTGPPLKIMMAPMRQEERRRMRAMLRAKEGMVVRAQDILMG